MLIEIRGQQFDTMPRLPVTLREIRVHPFVIRTFSSGYTWIFNSGDAPASIRWIQNIKPYMYFEPMIKPDESFSMLPVNTPPTDLPAYPIPE